MSYANLTVCECIAAEEAACHTQCFTTLYTHTNTHVSIITKNVTVSSDLHMYQTRSKKWNILCYRGLNCPHNISNASIHTHTHTPLGHCEVQTEVSDSQMRSEPLSCLPASFPSITEGQGWESSFGSIRGQSAPSNHSTFILGTHEWMKVTCMFLINTQINSVPHGEDENDWREKNPSNRILKSVSRDSD